MNLSKTFPSVSTLWFDTGNSKHRNESVNMILKLLQMLLNFICASFGFVFFYRVFCKLVCATISIAVSIYTSYCSSNGNAKPKKASTSKSLDIHTDTKACLHSAVPNELKPLYIEYLQTLNRVNKHSLFGKKRNVEQSALSRNGKKLVKRTADNVNPTQKTESHIKTSKTKELIDEFNSLLSDSKNLASSKKVNLSSPTSAKEKPEKPNNNELGISTAFTNVSVSTIYTIENQQHLSKTVLLTCREDGRDYPEYRMFKIKYAF